MQLAKFRIFIGHVRKDEFVSSTVSALEFYKLIKTQWYDEYDNRIEHEDIVRTLDRTKSTNTPSAAPGHTAICYFPVIEFDAIIAATFPTAPQHGMHDKVQERITTAINTSHIEYKSKYDNLTELLASDAIREIIDSEISKIGYQINSGVSLTSVAGAGAVGPGYALSLIYIDIDFFKQVNDRFGHQYGDLVLYCFSRRLQSVCTAYEQSSNGRLSIMLGRLGGEEFIIVVAGSLSLSEEDIIAEQIRSEIEGDILPSQPEWEDLKTRGRVREDEAPKPKNERRITISAGTASIRAPMDLGDATLARTRLHRQADLALYAAKGAGRNQVVAYRNVQARYGRLLEHNTDMNIVAISLGREFGVRVGQEFLVYHPLFIGDVPFMYADGRSEKQMGVYPRIPSGRIEVIDVQEEISFGRVRKSNVQVTFARNSPLEAVPLGSISHLLSDEGDSFRGPGHVGDIRAQIALRLEKKPPKDVSLCVISLDSPDKLAEERGAAYVNRVLAGLYGVIDRSLPAGSIVVQISAFEFAVLMPIGSQFSEKTFNDIEQAIRLEFRYELRIRAGVVDSACTAEFAETGGAPLLMSGAIELAHYTIAANSDSANFYARFENSVPEMVLYRSRVSGDLKTAEKDFEILSKFNAINADADQQIALIYHQSKEMDKALAAIARAIRKRPTSEWIWLNSAIISFRSGDLLKSVEHYKEYVKRSEKNSSAKAYPVVIAQLLSDAYTSGIGNLSKGEVRIAVEEALRDADCPARLAARFRDFLQNLR